MFNVTFGIKLDNEEECLVFGSPNKFKNYSEAIVEADIILNKHMKKLFTEFETEGFVEIPDEYEAWYENNSNQLIVARLDVTFNEGEFYILITRDKLIN